MMRQEIERKFVHRISKGSRFNQIYIPREIESEFEVGDIVEVRILEKKNHLYYSNNLKKLSEFKEKIISDIFKILTKNKKIEQIIVFGSFLTKEIDYRDIDIIIFGEEEDEEYLYHELTKKLKLKFHIISARKDSFQKTLEICPVTRNMVYHFVSNKEFQVTNKIRIDENHLKYLLMMPEDLLRVKLDGGEVYYNSLRKLVTIEHFLKRSEIAPDKIDDELHKLIDKDRLDMLKNDWKIEGKFLKFIRKIIKSKLNTIYETIENGKKR